MLAGSKKLHGRCSAICKFVLLSAEQFLTGACMSFLTSYQFFNAFQLYHRLSFMLLLCLAFLPITASFYLDGAMTLEI